MKDLSKLSIKEKVVYVASTMDIEDGATEFCYFEEMMNVRFSKDPDFPIIKEKMDNLVALFYEKNKNPEEFEKFLEMDLEEEVWDMI